MSLDRGKCKSCGKPILWVRMKKSGKPMPVDPWDTPAPLVRLVAVNPKTGQGKVLTEADLKDAFGWHEQGVTFHKSHYSTCPKASWHRKRGRRSKQELDADEELERVQQKFPDLFDAAAQA